MTEALHRNGGDLLCYLQRRAPKEAADLLGTTLLVAWRRRDDAPAEQAELRLWLYGIARMTLKGHARDEGRRLRLTDRVRALATTPPQSDDALAVDVRQAIDALPEKQRELVQLLHWEGLTIAEAATVLGLNPSTARGRYAKARAALKAALASALTETR